VNQIAGKISEEDNLVEPYFIQGSGNIWCYKPNSKSMVRLPRGIYGFIISLKEDNLGRVLFYSEYGDIVVIEKEELITIGFN